jgi:hypothetical protein
MHNAISLHAFQLLPQHFLRNAGNCALKVGKTHNLATEEMEENDELPSAFEQTQRRFNIGSGRGRPIALRHHTLLTYFFVRTSHYRSMVKGAVVKAKAWKANLASYGSDVEDVAVANG